MIVWAVGYAVAGLLSVGVGAWSSARRGCRSDPADAGIIFLFWPVFSAVLIGEMIGEREWESK